MSFANPLLLWGAAAAAVPVVLHLLMRVKPVEREWSAMRWLLEAFRSSSRRRRLEELIVLLLRVLAAVLIAFAAANPLAGTAGLRPRKLVILDVSCSMRAEGVFGRAKAEAERELVPGGLFALADVELRLARPSEAASAEPSFRSTNMALALRRALEELERRGREAAEIVIVSDMQRTGWLDASGEMKDPSLRTVLERCSWASVRFVDCASGKPNRTVTALERASGAFVAGLPMGLRARVESSRARDEFHVTLPGGEVRKVETRDGAAEIEFDYTPPEPKELRLTASVERDSFAPDDVRHFSASVRPLVRVLLLDGDPGVRRSDSEAFYLREALRGQGFEVEVFPGWTDPAEFDVVVCANLDAALVDADELSVFERRGGVAAFFAGDKLDASAYSGLLGVKMGAPEDCERTIDASRLDHEAVSIFRGTGAFAALTVRRRVPVAAEGLLFYDDGLPAVVARGRMLFFTFTADRAWSDLAVRPEFLPLVREALFAAASGSGARRDFLAGESPSIDLPPAEFPGPFELLSPGGGRIAVKVSAGVLQLPECERPGFYLLRSPAREMVLCANVDPEEGRLDCVRTEEMKSLLPALRAGPGARGAGRAGYWRAFAAAALAVLLLETFLARVFGRSRA